MEICVPMIQDLQDSFQALGRWFRIPRDPAGSCGVYPGPLKHKSIILKRKMFFIDRTC